MVPQVDDYIRKQQSPQKEIIQRIRKIFHDTLPGCEEKMAWGVITFSGGKFYLAAMKTRVHVGFAITGLSREELRLFEGTGKTMKHIKIHSVDEIDEKHLVQLIKKVNKKAICTPC